MAHSSEADSPVRRLEERLGRQWLAIRKAREDTQVQRKRLRESFAALDSPDTALVVFGSVARDEVTTGSDLDWILLVDGQSIPEHKAQELQIARLLEEGGFGAPGKSGVFGRMVGSHGLVHNIGGEDDLNSNTTRRILLLLESLPVGNREAYDRVRRQIIKRYLQDDRGLTHGSGDIRIPRFLLNDLTRYWRTITVDFVYKQRADDGVKWALRNAKLRMSRKLVFAAGLAHVFLCHLDPAAEGARRALRDQLSVSALTSYLERRLQWTPLEVIAHALLELNVPGHTALDIFDSYNAFLAILDDLGKRDELARAKSHEDLRTSPSWQEVRDVSRPFHRGLVSLFLRNQSPLADLTLEYGVF